MITSVLVFISGIATGVVLVLAVIVIAMKLTKGRWTQHND